MAQHSLTSSKFTRIEEQHLLPFSPSPFPEHPPTSQDSVWTIFASSPYHEDGLEYTIYPTTPNSPYYLIYKWANCNLSGNLSSPQARHEIVRVYYLTGVQPPSPLERNALLDQQSQHPSNQTNPFQFNNLELFAEEEEWRKMQDGVLPGTIFPLPTLYHVLYTKFLQSVDTISSFSDTLRMLHEINTNEINNKIALEEKKQNIIQLRMTSNPAESTNNCDDFLDDSNLAEMVRVGDEIDLIQQQLTSTIQHFDFDHDFT